MTPGSDSGSTIRKKKPSLPAPSIDAASSISSGIARRNGTRMMIVTGSPKPICGRITPPRLLMSPKSADQDVQGRDRDRDREHQSGGEQRVERAAAPELVPSQHVAAHQPERDDRSSREQGDDRRVAHLTPERRVGQDVDVVGDLPRGWQSCGVLRDLRVRPEATEDDVQDRGEHDGDEQQRDEVGRRAGAASGPGVHARPLGRRLRCRQLDRRGSHRVALSVRAPAVSRRSTKRW